MPSILFICTANQFRSPIAAACLRRELEGEPGHETWLVESAGTWTHEAQPAPGFTLNAARGLGLAGLEDHASRQVNLQLLVNYDVLIVMESGHKEALASEFPSIQARLFLLSEITTNNGYDIPDPARQGTDYMEIAAEIFTLVKTGKNQILNLARTLHQ